MAQNESIRWKCVDHFNQAKGDTPSLLQYSVRRLLLIRDAKLSIPV